MASALTPLPARYSAALQGDLRGLPVMATNGALQEGPRTHAWRVAAQALWSYAQPDRAAVPALPEIDPLLAEPQAWDGATHGLSHLARHALLELDLPRLGRCVERLNALRAHPPATLWADLFDGFQKALAGDGAGAVRTGEALYRRGAELRFPMITVEATTLQSLGAVVQGDFALAHTLARRSARMAQTEHLWLSHYFASIALARARRLSGNPHLAHRIADACLAVTAPVWHGWLLWERVWSGALEPTGPWASSEGLGRVHQAARSVLDWLGGCPHSTESGYARYQAAQQLVTGSALHDQDLRAAAAATILDASIPEASQAVNDFVRGTSARTPGELAGLVIPQMTGAQSTTMPVVVVRRGRAPQRVLGFARPHETELLPSSGTQPTRVDAIIATVALSGTHGIDREHLFEQVYGFKFKKSLHEATFKVLRHHAKQHVAPVAALQSNAGRYFLECKTDFAVIDPRCQRPLHDIMLRFLAKRGGATARDLSHELAVPLRSVQSALKQMVGDGVCAASRQGRQIGYEVQDTTFCEITVA